MVRAQIFSVSSSLVWGKGTSVVKVKLGALAESMILYFLKEKMRGLGGAHYNPSA
jgi:hypothetical protein